ncbi:MAG TPA: serine hydrolase [Streptosporangiaceae bacterium]|nr:serine hydrolase [Streptosporangiaceae bacterium]
MTGRHSSRERSGGLPNPALALGAVFLAAVVISAILVKVISHPASTARPVADGGAPHHAAAAPAPSSASARPPASASASASARPPASASASATAPASRPDPFGAATAAFLGGRSGTVLAAVYDVRTHQTWTAGTGPPQDEASIVKLDILETLLAQRAKSGSALSGSDSSLAQSMIEDSDNNSATDLWDAVGGGTGIGTFNSAAGLAQTTPSGCVVCPGFPWPGWGLTRTVPADQLTLLREIVEPSGLLTAADRSYALGLMENVTPSQRWGVSGGVPSSVTVALKNGWLPLNDADTDWQVNSIGWVSGQGRDYLIAVLTTGNATEQHGIDTISGLSAILWQHLQ